MIEYRDVLERQLDLLAPPRITIDRLTRRRDRKRRNQRITAGIVAVAISVLAITGLVRASRLRPRPADRPTPTPVVDPTTTETTFLDIASGEETPLPDAIASIPDAREFQVSPDGTSVTFVGLQRGDVRTFLPQLYVADVDGTTVRMITWDQDIEVAHPRWSPDGARIVFEGNTGAYVDIFVVDVATGDTTRLTRGLISTPLFVVGLMPSFRPDGRAIIFTMVEGNSVGLRTIPLSGGTATRLLAHAALGSYSKDGTRLAYRNAMADGSVFGLGEVLVSSADGRRSIVDSDEITMGGSGLWDESRVDASVPMWSPDGTRLLALDYHSRYGPPPVRLIDAETGAETRIGFALEANWFDDETLIVRRFDSSRPDPSSPSPSPSIDVALPADLSFVDIATGNSTLLPESIRSLPDVHSIQVSPDGSMFAFEAAVEPGGHRQVYVADVEGFSIRRISYGTWQAFHPSWSPDGTQILYEGLAITRTVGIYVADASGEGRRRVLTLSAGSTYPPYAAMPRFSPDGTKILFTRRANRSIGLWTTSPDGGSTRRVLGGAAFGSYSPDGRSIVYRDANLSPGLQTGISFYGDVRSSHGAQTGNS